MAVPSLLLANIIIWSKLYRDIKQGRATGPFPENPLFDYDLDKFWVECPAGGCETPATEFYPGMSCQGCSETVDEKLEEKLIKQDFLAWWEIERKKDPDLTDILWKEGILNPEEYVVVEGMFLIPGDPEDLQAYMRVRSQAQLRQQYNDINFPEGQVEMDIAWFMLKGCSRYGAEQLMAHGVRPWEFEEEW